MSVKWMACVVVLCSTPVFAQSNATPFALDRTSFAPAHAYVAADAIPKQLSLPANLIVSSHYRALVEHMLRGSPAFRRQCLRISGEPRLTVKLRMGGPQWKQGFRATTHIERERDGRMTAFIEVFPLNEDVELISHEIEHVIEQLDEVDLASHAARRDTGVRVHAGNVFETVRANRTGLKVRDEVRAFTERR